MKKKYVIGIDYGTDSCRGVIVSTVDGSEIAEHVFYYPRWAKKLYCSPKDSMYRQHPLDYIEGLHSILENLTNTVNEEILKEIVGISVDTTGSTPCVVDERGMPLALKEEFKDNPNAMFVLWKDHTSVKEAEEITETAKNWGGIDYTQYIGGVYSSEWYFAKLLNIFRNDDAVRDAFHSFVEHCDFIPALLTGVDDVDAIKRSRCAGGHKSMWHEDYNGLPSQEFLSTIDSLFDGIREKLYDETFTADVSVGKIDGSFVEKYNLPENTKIGIGAFDSHMGAVGGNIHENALVKVIGTSTCDIVIKNNDEVKDQLIEGICGQVNGSVVKGKLGMEAGQSAFGDFYAWYKSILEWPLKFIENDEDREAIADKILYALEKEAKKLEPSEVITLDWINGRRTPFANQNLKAAIMGLDLSVDAPRLYRSIIESTVYGAKAIADQFKNSNIELDQIIAIGGVAKKSALAMQIMADVTNMPVHVSKSEQAVALGAACFAAVVGGVYKTIEEAQENMASAIEITYEPEPKAVKKYEVLYKKYLAFAASQEKNFY